MMNKNEVLVNYGLGEYKGNMKDGSTLLLSIDKKCKGNLETTITTIEGVIEKEGKVLSGNFNKQLQPHGNIRVFDLELNRTVFEGEYKNGNKEGRGKVVLKGDYLSSLDLQEYKVPLLNYSLEFNPDEYYALEGYYKGDRLQTKGKLRIVDILGDELISKYDNNHINYENGYLEITERSIKIREGNEIYNFYRKDGLVEVDCFYSIEGNTKKGRLYIDLNSEDEILKGEDYGKEKYIIVEITNKLPNLLKNKLKRYLNKSNCKENVQSNNEGIVIEM